MKIFPKTVVAVAKGLDKKQKHDRCCNLKKLYLEWIYIDGDNVTLLFTGSKRNISRLKEEAYEKLIDIAGAKNR